MPTDLPLRDLEEGKTASIHQGSEKEIRAKLLRKLVRSRRKQADGELEPSTLSRQSDSTLRTTSQPWTDTRGWLKPATHAALSEAEILPV